MSRRETQGHSWDEVTATQQLCMAASPPIVYAEFTGTQEDGVGADWLWWWIDTTGEAFGMLVRAKKQVAPPGSPRARPRRCGRRPDRDPVGRRRARRSPLRS